MPAMLQYLQHASCTVNADYLRIHDTEAWNGKTVERQEEVESGEPSGPLNGET